MSFYEMQIGLDRFRQKHGLSGSTLKIIAIVTMLIDHIAASLYFALKGYSFYYAHPDRARQIVFCYNWMRKIGRIAFPIFCFFIIEGFLHTHSVKKYARNLFVFALISQFPFTYALHPDELHIESASEWYKVPIGLFTRNNVYFTLLIGLLVLYAVRELNGRIMLQLVFMAAGMMLANLLHTDYSWHGVFLIELLYILRFSRFFQVVCGGAFMEYEGLFGALALIPAFFYNGKRGRQLKYFFYAFYPGHLLILGIIRNLIFPAILV